MTTPDDTLRDHRAMDLWRHYQFCVHLHVDGFHVYAAGQPEHSEPLAVDPDPAVAILAAAKKRAP